MVLELYFTLILLAKSSDPSSWIVGILRCVEVLWLRDFHCLTDLFLFVGVAGRFGGWSVWCRGFAILGVGC